VSVLYRYVVGHHNHHNLPQFPQKVKTTFLAAYEDYEQICAK